jgi:Zn-dependent protease
MNFSEKEIFDLVKAWIAISIAFGIYIAKDNLVSLFSPEFSTYLLIAAFTVGIGFLLHELGHKFMAQKYKFLAEFRSYDPMLILAILISFLGVIFIAPGAVMIHGYYMTKEKNGKISAAGPIVNLALAFIFLALFFLGIDNLFIYYGAFINSLIALFNMIPLGPLDGKKIIKWSKPIYYSMLVVGIIFLFVSSAWLNV